MTVILAVKLGATRVAYLDTIALLENAIGAGSGDASASDIASRDQRGRDGQKSHASLGGAVEVPETGREPAGSMPSALVPEVWYHFGVRTRVRKTFLKTATTIRGAHLYSGARTRGRLFGELAGQRR